MANLEVDFCGVRIKNPLVAASPEPTLNAANMKKCIDTGVCGDWDEIRAELSSQE